MNEQLDQPEGLGSAITTILIGHICIRDPDTGEIIVSKRDKSEKASND